MGVLHLINDLNNNDQVADERSPGGSRFGADSQALAKYDEQPWLGSYARSLDPFTRSQLPAPAQQAQIVGPHPCAAPTGHIWFASGRLDE